MTGRFLLWAALVLGVCSCQYRFGEGGGALGGAFFVDRFTNETNYRLFSGELQNALMEVLRRQKDVTIAKREDATTLVSGRLVGVERVPREIDIHGNVAEGQYVLTFRLVVERGGQKSEHTIRNTDRMSSSGTFRSDRTPDEETGKREAVRDLAEAAVMTLGGAW